MSLHRGFNRWRELPIWARDQLEDNEAHEGRPPSCRIESTSDGAVSGVPHT